MTESLSKSESALTPRRYLALWFPFLATDRLKRENCLQRVEPDDRPCVIVEKIKGALSVIAVDQRAVALGIARGVTLADARARIPDLTVYEADSDADFRFTMRLAELCNLFTPQVALDPPNGLLLDISGCGHLFGGETKLREKAVRRLSLLGLSVASSIAGTPEAARALSRFSKTGVVPRGQDEAFVRRLPVAALAGLEHETIVALSRAGLKTVGDLADRPREALAARFGQNFIAQLMRTLGRENARMTPLRPVAPIVLEKHFAEPFTQTDAIEGILADLIANAAHILQMRDEGGRCFETSLFRSDGAVRRLAVQTGRPSRDTQTILKLYRERLSTLADPLDPGFGFDAIRLCVTETETLRITQPSLDQSSIEDHSVSDLVDQLIVRFGRERVLRFDICDTHNPDRAARFVSAAKFDLPKSSAQNEMQSALHAPQAGEPPRRPLQLFARPQAIEALAEVPDGPPLRFRWRRVLHDVARAEGPERIAPEWWRTSNAAEARDYYRVEDSHGCRFWIFRQGQYGKPGAPPRWFLHGVFA